MNIRMVAYVLGRIFLVEAGLMLLPLGCAALYGEATLAAFLVPIGVLVALGCALGLALHWFLYSSLVSRTFGVAWGVPWPELALIVAVILLTSALAVRRPARRLLGLSIVEAIAAQ